MPGDKVGAVMVVGGGIAGIQASLDLAESGFKVYLVDKDISIGGKMACLDKTFPTNDCATCILAPKLVTVGKHPNVEIITQAQLDHVSGEAGHFQVRLQQAPRYVRAELCNGCGDCVAACPVEATNSFDQGLSTRKAIYRHTAQAVPNAFAIEKKGVAPCRKACPAGQRAQGYITLVALGRYKEALRVIKEDNPFPSVCGRTCHHPCEGHCVRALADEAVGIMSLKRFVVDYALTHGRDPVQCAPRTRPEQVAVVGAGPAGLTAAHDLALMGYGVTVFEALPVPGGMMRWGIPAHRLPKDALQQDIDDILALGVALKTSAPVRDPLALLSQGYHAVCLATGLSTRDHSLGIEGEETEGVISAATFLRKVNMGEALPDIGQRVVVAGGGITAVDAAAVARRLGAEAATLLLNRARNELPAYQWEIDEVEQEGVKILEKTTATRIFTRNGRVAGVECVRTLPGEIADEKGRRRPRIEPGTEFTLEADTIIRTIGQFSDLCFLDAHFDDLAPDLDTLATSTPGLFVVAGRKTGASFIIEAVALGHRVAKSIDRYLQNQPLVAKAEPAPPAVKVTRDEIAERIRKGEIQLQQRARSATLPVEERVTSSREVVLGLTESQARAEAERCLQCGVCSECLVCVRTCGLGAIDHEMTPRTIELDVGAIILSTGFDQFDARALGEYGYGMYPNVITSLEFERMLSASGPFEGHLRRLSDGAAPRRIAFIQCVGSRNPACGNDYCSSVCCMYATKQAIIASEHQPGLETTIFYIDVRAFGKGFYRYYQRAKDEHGVRYVRSMISSIQQRQPTKSLVLRYVEDGRAREQEFDLVILSVGLRPSSELAALCDRLGLTTGPHGFCAPQPFAPVETSRPGIYACGTISGPKDIPQTVMEASAAAACAAQLLAPARGRLVREKQSPPERSVADEEPRIGAFFCHCGSNIGGVVDVPAVAEFARSMPGVVVAEESLHLCAPDAQARIKELVTQHRLNRVLAAACSPRTHEPLFQETLEEVGLNRYLFEMANVRDQCSWVHSSQPERATEKAKTLVRMGLSRAHYLTPLYSTRLDLDHRALVIGGGLAGMTAACALAGQGFEVYLIEKQSELGGNLCRLHYTLEGNHTQDYLAGLIKQVRRDPLIHVYTKAQVERVEGCIGNFVTTVQSAKGEVPIALKHGVTIVATGASESKPSEYLYGQDPRVLTQLDLEQQLANPSSETPSLRASVRHTKSVVMIQCVGSRNEERPYCSRVCCSQALKNALKLKEINPQAEIFILYRDLMSYGLKEEYYTRARAANVHFIRYDLEQPPRVRHGETRRSEAGPGPLIVSVRDASLNTELDLTADMLVLSVATAAPQENKALAQVLKVPLDSDGFFLEAHMKLRPVDFATEGIFVCGLAHSPKFMEETITQAQAVASRAATILSKAQIESEAMLPVIDLDRCIGCAVCESACAFHAIQVRETDRGKRAEVILAACKGCGTCGAACPQVANVPGHFTDRQLMAQINALAETPRISANGFEPKVLGFLCNWCAYAGADLAGVSRLPYPPNLHVARVMCTGRIDPALVVEALLQGIDGVMVLGCHPGDCHYSAGNLHAQERIGRLKQVFVAVGLDTRRFRLDWVSASEGARFSELVKTFTEQIRELGPIA